MQMTRPHRVAESLVHCLDAAGGEVIALVGLAKNCGKTTTLNCLVQQFDKTRLRLGLTSIGRDGEAIDAVTRRDKPRIHVRTGTVFVTAAECLDACGVRLRVLGGLGMRSAMGELLAVEARSSGNVELAGPVTMKDVQHVVAYLKRLGAERVLLDGALDRRSSGAPSVADAVVLSAGAVLAPSVEGVVSRLAHQVLLLRAIEPSMAIQDAIHAAAADHPNHAVVLQRDGRMHVLPTSALKHPDAVLDLVTRETVAIWTGGSVTSSLLNALLDLQLFPEIVALNGTRFFLSRMTAGRWAAAGGRLSALEPVNLAAITLNAHNPTGPDLDPGHLIEATARAIPDVPIFDVVHGLEHLATSHEVSA